MLAIFEANAGTFDAFALVAAILFVVAAFLSLPARDDNTPVRAYNWTLAMLASAVFAFAFLFMTP